MELNILMPALVIVAVAACFALLFMGGREIIGEALNKLFPKDPIHKGDKVNIFLNERYNRTATITNITSDKVFIYDRIGLPVDYRGRFYATGTDTNDGSKIVYIKYNSRRYKFVRIAEIIRKVFNVFDDTDNLPVDESTDANEADGGADEEGADNEV